MFFHSWHFLLRGLESCPAIRATLLDLVEGDDGQRVLQLQLAITIDVGELFAQKTYSLEGDGDMIVDAYTHLQELSTAADIQHYHLT